MEQVLCSKELCSGRFHTVIVTKSKAAAAIMIGDRSELLRMWAEDSRKRPLKISGFSKKFMQDMFGMLDMLRSNRIADVVLIEDSEEDKKNKNLLTEHTVHLDIDPEEDYSKNKGEGDQEDMMASDAKHRNLLRQELLELGVRSTRTGHKLTKKQRQEVAKKEGHKAPTPAPAHAPVEKKKEAQDTKEEEEKHDAEPVVDKPNPHSGLAAAVAAEELRAAAANAAATSGSGGRAAPRDGAGDVQEPEHGACGGSGEAAQGAGECQAAAADTPEHLA
jgi:hypothetical protein